MKDKLQDLEPTRRSLLDRMKDLEDQASWNDFFNKYWRLIYTVALRSGLSDADAQDIVQETILAVCKNIQSFEYQAERCSFHGWLLLLTRHRIYSHLRKKRSSPETVPLVRQDDSGLSKEFTIADLADPPLEAIWNQEWEKNLITAASESVKKQVSAKQFQIFDLYVIQNLPVKRVAEALKVSTAQIYVTKHRVGRLMKKAVHAIENHGDS